MKINELEESFKKFDEMLSKDYTADHFIGHPSQFKLSRTFIVKTSYIYDEWVFFEYFYKHYDEEYINKIFKICLFLAKSSPKGKRVYFELHDSYGYCLCFYNALVEELKRINLLPKKQKYVFTLSAENDTQYDDVVTVDYYDEETRENFCQFIETQGVRPNDLYIGLILVWWSTLYMMLKSCKVRFKDDNLNEHSNEDNLITHQSGNLELAKQYWGATHSVKGNLFNFISGLARTFLLINHQFSHHFHPKFGYDVAVEETMNVAHCELTRSMNSQMATKKKEARRPLRDEVCKLFSNEYSKCKSVSNNEVASFIFNKIKCGHHSSLLDMLSATSDETRKQSIAKMISDIRIEHNMPKEKK